MNIFQRLERTLWLGEVVQDYGIISEQKMGGAFQKISLLLCRRKGEIQLVIKTSAFAFLAASVRYEYLPVSVIPKLRSILDDMESLSHNQ